MFSLVPLAPTQHRRQFRLSSTGTEAHTGVTASVDRAVLENYPGRCTGYHYARRLISTSRGQENRCWNFVDV